MASCPECDIEITIDEIDLEELEVGDPWVCEGCASNLRVAALDPLEFDPDDDDEDDEKAVADEGAEDDIDDDGDDDEDADDWDD